MPQIPGGLELVLVLAVILLLFGGKKIPELAKGLGQGIKNFKKSVKDDDKVDLDEEPKKVEASESEVKEVSKESEKQA